MRIRLYSDGISHAMTYHDEHAVINVGRDSLVRLLMEEADRLEEDYGQDKIVLFTGIDGFCLREGRKSVSFTTRARREGLQSPESRNPALREFLL